MKNQQEMPEGAAFNVLDGELSYLMVLPDWRTDYIQGGIAQKSAPYEVEMLRDLAGRLQPGDNVVDIGANIGNHTLYLAASGMNVDAFEPDASLTSAIKASASANSLDDSVRVHTTALGAVATAARLVRGDESNIGKQRVVADSADGHEVQILPLDDTSVRRPVRAMKIDVEGMEPEVIAGAAGVIAEDAPLLYIEAATRREFSAVAKVMTMLGYVCWDVFNATPTYLFIHQDQLTEKDIAARSLLKSFGEVSSLHEDIRQLRSRHQKEVRGLKERLATPSAGTPSTSTHHADESKSPEVARTAALVAELASVRGALDATGQRMRAERSRSRSLGAELAQARREREPSVEQTSAQTNHVIEGEPSRGNPVDDRLEELRVALVTDAPSTGLLAPDVQVVPVTSSAWERDLAETRPDFLLVESSSLGSAADLGSETADDLGWLGDVVSWCRERSIPAVLWVDAGAPALAASREFDLVFVPDVESLPRYTEILGRDRVHLLPRAYQPAFHSPTSRVARREGCVFLDGLSADYTGRDADLQRFAESIPTVEIYRQRISDGAGGQQIPDGLMPYVVEILNHEGDTTSIREYDDALILSGVTPSQTAVPASAFEVLGSGTGLVSNYSRALRVLFGELAVTTDDAPEAARRLGELQRDPQLRDSRRLVALRKVLREHTYAHRLSFMAQKTLGLPTPVRTPMLTLLGHAPDEATLRSLLEHRKRQAAGPEVAYLWVVPESLSDLVPVEDRWCTQSVIEGRTVADLVTTPFCGALVAQDYYGPNYAVDMLLALRHSDAVVWGKAAFYRWADGEASLVGGGSEHAEVESLAVRRAIVRTSLIGAVSCSAWLTSAPGAVYSGGRQVALDRFGYCERGEGEAFARETIDGRSFDEGALLSDLQARAAAAVAAPAGKMLEFEEIGSWFDGVVHPQISHVVGPDGLTIRSKVAPGKTEYFLAGRALSVETFRPVTDSEAMVRCSTGLDIRVVLIYNDHDGARLGASFALPGKSVRLEVPPGAAEVRFGFRIVGPGESTVDGFGPPPVADQPALVVSRADHLVITSNYPRYDDLYRNAFVHSRLLGYRDAGISADVFRFRTGSPLVCDEFQGVDAFTGGAPALRQVIEDNEHRSVLVHVLTPAVWNVLNRQVTPRRITIWLHGAEARSWERLKHNFEPDGPPQKVKDAADARLDFWRTVFDEAGDHVHFVFVSQTFAKQVMEDVGIRLDPSRYSVIHNPIDVQLFEYVPKAPAQRLNILSIRPFASRTYANDLTVKAILDLRTEEWFDELSFTIVGDGPLFADTVEPLRGLLNVTLLQKFLTRQEIAELHRVSGVFMVPTRIDSQGVSRDEAMSSGLVPITCAVAAVPEFVDERSGILVEAEDWKGLADAIRLLWGSPEMFTRLSEEAAARVRRQSASDLVISAEIATFRR